MTTNTTNTTTDAARTRTSYFDLLPEAPTTNMVRDQYAEVHRSLESFKDAVRRIEANSDWSEAEGSSVRVEKIAEHQDAFSLAVLEDTVNGSGLMMSVGGTPYAMRNTAKGNLDTLLKGAISGIPNSTYVEVANLLLPYIKKMRVLERNEKITGVLSGNYRIIPQNDVFAVTLREQEETFGTLEFMDGVTTQTFSSVTVAMPEQQEKVEEILRSKLDAEMDTAVMPLLRISTGDAGNCSATLRPMLRFGSGRPLSFCKPLKLRHKGDGNAWSEDLQKMQSQVMSLFAASAEQLAMLAATDIANPRFAVINACNSVRLAAKYYKNALDVATFQFEEEGELTAYDIVIQVMEAVSDAAELDAKISPLRKLELEDTVSRLIRVDWGEMDVPFILGSKQERA